HPILYAGRFPALPCASLRPSLRTGIAADPVRQQCLSQIWYNSVLVCQARRTRRALNLALRQSISMRERLPCPTAERCRTSEPIAEAEAADLRRQVGTDRHGLSESRRVADRDRSTHRAEVDVEVFRSQQPVSVQRPLHATACRPTRPDRRLAAVTRAAREGRVDGIVAIAAGELELRKGKAARRVHQDVRPDREAKACANGGEPVRTHLLRDCILSAEERKRKGAARRGSLVEIERTEIGLRAIDDV